MPAFYRVVGMRNPSRSYYLPYSGRLHSLKAVVTYALQRTSPDVRARDFHAADAASKLRELDFKVVHGLDEFEQERERIWVQRLARPEQRKFRELLIDACGGCLISGCTTLSVLEAAHVNPVASKGVDTPANGVLLRADLHKLFDLDLLAIDPDSGRISLAARCADDYGELVRDFVYPERKGGPLLQQFRQRWSDHLVLR